MVRFIAFAMAPLVLAGTVAVPAQAAGTLAGLWAAEKEEPALVPLDGKPVPLNAEGVKAYAANKATLAEMAAKPTERNDLRRCLPLGPTRIMEQTYPVQIVETPTDVILMWEHNHAYETVYLNQKSDAEEDWAYMGNSVGTRARDGLVVTTTGFNDQTFLDNTGLPHGDGMKLVRKFRLLPDGKSLEITSTITDPAFYSRPWSVRHMLTARPGDAIQEYVCGQGPVLENRQTRAVGPEMVPSMRPGATPAAAPAAERRP